MKYSKTSILLVLALLLTLTSCQVIEDPSDDSEIIDIDQLDDASVDVDDDLELERHDSPSDYEWDEQDVVDVDLDQLTDDTYQITEGGTYRLSGDYTGQIQVEADDDMVQLILDDASIHSENSAAISVESADKLILILADGSENSLSDADDYSFDSDEDEPNATLFSKSDLTIYSEGSGTLTVIGNYNDAIASKDGLIFYQADVALSAVDDGVRGKDYVVIQDSDIVIEAEGDGIKSDGANDLSTGVISINGGTIQVDSAQDAIVAEKEVVIEAGVVELVSGDGSAYSVNEEQSQKGIKATELITINGGTVLIDSADDALHSNGDLEINGGTIELSSGDDGIHADADVTISDGDILIAKSYEGIEGGNITIIDGTIDITASDDGLNVAGGNDQSSMGRPGQGDFMTASGDYHLSIQGGTISIDSGGDGLDSNGTAEMSGGTVIVNGPTNDGNGALDSNGGFEVNGGVLIAVGSSGMAEAPEESSSQYALRVNFDDTQSAGTTILIEDADGVELLSFTPDKQFQSIVYSSADIEMGATYTVSLDGSEVTTFTIESTITSYGSTTGFGGGGGGRGNFQPGDMDSMPSMPF
jgi:hypothetical protein